MIWFVYFSHLWVTEYTLWFSPTPWSPQDALIQLPPLQQSPRILMKNPLPFSCCFFWCLEPKFPTILIYFLILMEQNLQYFSLKLNKDFIWHFVTLKNLCSFFTFTCSWKSIWHSYPRVMGKNSLLLRIASQNFALHLQSSEISQ